MAMGGPLNPWPPARFSTFALNLMTPHGPIFVVMVGAAR